LYITATCLFYLFIRMWSDGICWTFEFYNSFISEDQIFNIPRGGLMEHAILKTYRRKDCCAGSRSRYRRRRREKAQ
jgi:hypothetical protein